MRNPRIRLDEDNLGSFSHVGKLGGRDDLAYVLDEAVLGQT